MRPVLSSPPVHARLGDKGSWSLRHCDVTRTRAVHLSPLPLRHVIEFCCIMRDFDINAATCERFRVVALGRDVTAAAAEKRIWIADSAVVGRSLVRALDAALIADCSDARRTCRPVAQSVALLMDRNGFRRRSGPGFLLPDPPTERPRVSIERVDLQLGHAVSACLLPHKSTCLYIYIFLGKTFFPRVERLVGSKKISF